MSKSLKVDFVSDVSCPWCAIGLKSLEQAMGRLEGEVRTDLHFQPFELNPGMAPEGQEIFEHLSQKYGLSAEQLARNSEGIRARGADVGFTFGVGKRTRIYNTFDAHRLLHWPGLQGRQLALKEALLAAYHTDGEDPSSHAVLVRRAGAAGLDMEQARTVLTSGQFADEVREREQFYLDQGVHSVPAVIINDRHLISGGQPVEVFEQALRQIAAATA